MEVLRYPEIAKVLKISTEAARMRLSRLNSNPNEYAGVIPAPDGYIGKSPYWLPDSVERFLKGGSNQKGQGGRKRKPPPSIN